MHAYFVAENHIWKHSDAEKGGRPPPQLPKNNEDKGKYQEMSQRKCYIIVSSLCHEPLYSILKVGLIKSKVVEN